jgi:hypothetical protein
MLVQHARIRGLVMGLGDEVGVGGAQPGPLEGIGELLEDHIRLEERQVFPMIEEALSEEALEEVADRLAAAEAGPNKAEPWVPAAVGLSYDPWPGQGDSEGGGWDH